jgi:2-C-methyl-D-erythritol 2,4-cyclodiphosphate synthase
MLGGVHVPAEFGALGHSDADVLAHAIADALLGAAALGSLGDRFPDSDERYKDADSLALLAECAQAVGAIGFVVENIDATVVVQAPRLAPFLGEMRERVAQAVGLAVDLVSIKAKSSEGLGYTGDGSGIVAYAVTLLRTEHS